MTDPLDLEALKERQADRENDGYWDADDVKADLHRAIEIAEEQIKLGAFVAKAVRDQVDDILMLRKAYFDSLGSDPFWQANLKRAFAATAHYEQHRQTQEGEA